MRQHFLKKIAPRALFRGPERGTPTRRRPGPLLEQLEGRALLSTVSVNAGQVVRPVNTQLLGVNVNWWDTNLNTAQTRQMVQAAGMTMFRFPGGSSSDDFHFNQPPSYNGKGTDASMASFINSVNGQGVVTLDYGSGSPQEAAAFLAYLNGSPTNTTPIGTGEEWNDSTNSWQQVNWQTAGYWASLRASTPLATDDGLNFLRLDHPAPFGFTYFEVGNEEYGGWEIDHHGQGTDTGKPHDPATYVAFAKQFAAYAAQIDPSISVGVDTGSPYENGNWISLVLQQSAEQGFTPGFLSDHNYVQAPGSESDSNLLFDTTSDPNATDPNNPYDWATRAADYEALIQQYLGSAGKNVQLLATEFNSVYSNPGKQTTSLVNGLWLADSLGVLMNSPYAGATVWGLRNSWNSGGNNASSLYGWRQGGDYGLLGSPGGPAAPATGAYVPYPTYFAEQLASKIIQTGGNVVQASSDDPNLDVYAVLEADGDLDLMVINKSATSALNGQFQLANFQPATTAQAWQYGEAQDTAQSQTTDGQSALAHFVADLSVSGSNFSYSFPAYSMTVLDLGKAGQGVSGPVITAPAAAGQNPVAGTTAALSVAATDPAGASNLTYTWSAIGTVPAPVSFSANGTSAAANTTATFTKAGTYTFQVTVADPSDFTATSSVVVTVNSTLTSIAVSPGSATVAAGGSETFSARALDQFHEPLSTQPAFAWSVTNGGGTIGASTGVYQAPSTTGNATVQAAAGGHAGTATIAIAPPASGFASVTYSDVNDWGSGFTGNITITNNGTAPINGWTLQFAFAPVISSIWNATIVSQAGGSYVIQNAAYNATIAPGQSVSFGFNGAPGHAFAGPTNYVLNGTPVAAPAPPPPVPVHASLTFADVNDWGSGFTGSITITNTGTAPINGWTVQFDFAPTITSIWNAVLVGRSGTRYTISDAGFNETIAPGQSVSFGFNATPGGGTIAGPTNVVLNGASLGGNAPALAMAVVPQSLTGTKTKTSVPGGPLAS